MNNLLEILNHQISKSDKFPRETYNQLYKELEPVVEEWKYVSSKVQQPEILQHIFRFASDNTPAGLQSLGINNYWKENAEDVLKINWKVLKRDLPSECEHIKISMDDIDQEEENPSVYEKCKKLSVALFPNPHEKDEVGEEERLENLPINVQGLQVLQNQIKDQSLQKIWGTVRNKLEELEVENLPGREASAAVIRMFLQNCEAVKWITELDLSDLVLSIIPAEINLFTGLTELSLSDNWIQVIENIDKLSQLKELNLSHNSIRKIKNLNIMAQLKNLDLSHNSIKKIENLNELLCLEVICLSVNAIEVIENLNLPNLKELDLSSNKISRIQGLNNTPLLNKLDLDNNQIAIIENLSKLGQLQTLHMSRNRVHVIQNMDSLVQLEVLSLSDNEIAKIENLTKLIRLKELIIQGNKIVKIENLDELSQLQTLNLRVNQIGEIENLNHLNNLVTLWLDNNKIWLIEGLCLPELVRLDLNYNSIAMIINLELPKLKYFHCSNNQIRVMENLNFPLLERLSLRWNKIEIIENIDHLGKLEWLYLQGNPLKAMRESDYEKLCSFRENQIDFSINSLHLLASDQGIDFINSNRLKDDLNLLNQYRKRKRE